MEPCSMPAVFLQCMWSGTLQVGVEKITLNGRMRMTLKPLMDDMPIVAAIQVGSALACTQNKPCPIC